MCVCLVVVRENIYSNFNLIVVNLNFNESLRGYFFFFKENVGYF